MNQEPKIYHLKELPQFAQMVVSDMWEKSGVNPEELQKRTDIVITYFDGIYTSKPLRQDVFVHEAVHFIRQGEGKDELHAKDWCLRYASDKAFRYAEELMAYKEQYRFILKQCKGNREIAFRELKRLATDLSGPMYGNICGFNTALNDIRAGVK